MSEDGETCDYCGCPLPENYNDVVQVVQIHVHGNKDEDETIAMFCSTDCLVHYYEEGIWQSSWVETIKKVRRILHSEQVDYAIEIEEEDKALYIYIYGKITGQAFKELYEVIGDNEVIIEPVINKDGVPEIYIKAW